MKPLPKTALFFVIAMLCFFFLFGPKNHGQNGTAPWLLLSTLGVMFVSAAAFLLSLKELVFGK